MIRFPNFAGRSETRSKRNWGTTPPTHLAGGLFVDATTRGTLGCGTKPAGGKSAWSQWGISYGLDFDRNKQDELSLNLFVWDDAKKHGVKPGQIEQLKQLSIVRNREFDYKKLDDGGVSVEKNLGPVRLNKDSSGKFAEMERVASDLTHLIEATHDLFDVPTETH